MSQQSVTYEDLKKEVVEGFANTTDEQFNQLILYIFTGLFYLLMLDMMYHTVNI